MIEKHKNKWPSLCYVDTNIFLHFHRCDDVLVFLCYSVLLPDLVDLDVISIRLSSSHQYDRVDLVCLSGSVVGHGIIIV